jgi:hypothetical protein
MKASTVRGMAVAAAAATMFIAGAGVSSAQDDGNNVVKIRCFGGNACKGQSACKTSSNECKGHNACKGQGFEFRGMGACADKPGRS